MVQMVEHYKKNCPLLENKQQMGSNDGMLSHLKRMAIMQASANQRKHVARSDDQNQTTDLLVKFRSQYQSHLTNNHQSMSLKASS